MISEKYKCVFIHIPKTAGQSIEHFFLNLHNLTWKTRSPLLLRFNPDPTKGPEALAHLTALEYVQYGYMTNELFASYFKFSFVRNPWERLVSEYKYRDRYGKHTFKEFVTDSLRNQNSYLDTYRHLIPQYEFLYNANNEPLVDFVGKFENLQSDFDFVCSKLGIINSQLPHVNSSRKMSMLASKIKKIFSKNTPSNKHYTEYYDTELRHLVEKLYFKDIDTFGYEFGH